MVENFKKFYLDYEINQDGEIQREKTDKNGEKYTKKYKINVDKCGYKFITITNLKKVKHFYIHHLIYKLFISDEPIKKGFEIDHKDRDKKNNNINNLRLVSKSTQQKNKNNVVGVLDYDLTHDITQYTGQPKERKAEYLKKYYELNKEKINQRSKERYKKKLIKE